MTKTMKLLATTILIGLFTVLSFAQVPAKIEGTRIQDFAQLLSPEQEAQLQTKTDQLKASKDIELGIILVNSTEGVAPVDYTTNIGRQFGIGSAEGEHRGIVFLLAINDRQCFIQPSRHISGTYTDGQMASICRSLRNQLRSQDYNGAINNGTDQLMTLASGVDSQQMQGIASNSKPTPTDSGGHGGIVLLIFGAFILVVGSGIGIALAISKHNERKERERQEAENEARRQRQEALRKLQEKEAQEERERHEAWLKTPEGIADTERKRKEAEEAARVLAERQRKAREEEARKAREYAIWAASPAGIAALALQAKQRKEDEERARIARKKREEEEEAERQRRRRQQEDDDRRRRDSSSSSFGWSSGSSSSSSDSGGSFGGFGGSSDFGGGGGGSSW